jgi:hypothetical protein
MDVRAEYEWVLKPFSPKKKNREQTAVPAGAIPPFLPSFFLASRSGPDARAGIHKAGNEAGLEKRKSEHDDEQ